MSLLIKNGRIVTAESNHVADVFVEKDSIVAIGPALVHHADRVVDATGKYVIPGGIDVHTHLDAPVGGTVSSDDFETGTRAGAFGGTTCIIDFATQQAGQSLSAALELWWKKGERATIDYGLHMIITDLPAAPLNGIDDCVREGVTSFKLFMAYPGTLMLDDETIFRIMRRAGERGALVCIHAEDGQAIDAMVREALAAGNTAPVYHALTRPTSTEAEAAHRAIALAHVAGVPVYIVHVSCNDSLREIADARGSGYPVFAETCPQYLLLSIDDLKRPGFEGGKYVLTPPLREKAEQEQLWQGLRENDLQVVSTDHCPFFFDGQKDKGVHDFTKIPNGGPGIENRLQLTYQYGVNEGRITLNRWVDIVSTTPARLFGLFPRKGTVAVGSDADLVVWDPARELSISSRTHHMRVDYSMYEGFRVKGSPDVVISRGEIIVENGEWLGRAGRGRYVQRECFGAAFHT